MIILQGRENKYRRILLFVLLQCDGSKEECYLQRTSQCPPLFHNLHPSLQIKKIIQDLLVDHFL